MEARIQTTRSHLMSNPWSRSVGEYGSTVRVFERRGICHISYGMNGTRVRRSLGIRDRPEALRRARRVAETLATAQLDQLDLTVKRLFVLFGKEKFGRLKPDTVQGYKRHARLWSRFLGGNRKVMDIVESDIHRFQMKRAAGDINSHGEGVARDKRPVRTRTIGMDLIFLKSTTRWAWQKGLIPRDPLAAYTVPHEKNPRRPVISDERIGALREVAERVEMEIRWYGKRTKARSYLLELIDLATHTGRRISAICGLREEDLWLTETVTAPHGAVLWPAATDKLGYEMLVPLNPKARAAIDRTLAQERPNTLLFPCPKDRNRPITKDLARAWHARAEKLAGLPPMKGTCWHAYRRRWVTKRKDLPLPDIAAAGGWKDLRTVQENYMQPDDETKLRVVMWE